MSRQRLKSFLGKDASKLLETEPYKHWPRQLEPLDPAYCLDRVYTFPVNGLELRCAADGKITTIFAYSQKFGGYSEFEPLFRLSRTEVLDAFGDPYKTGNRFLDPILGEMGARDLFKFQDHATHFTYGYNRDQVEMITLMTRDAVPV
ncbi:hypothetical protein [Aliiroseovarius sediminis]|uniref:hypothetical protein n=1 Tax=Aliiroseovarius sediminis TaxID=2925839 RepID=UPI001F562EAB|nr:hypothetical protein [Aliiroseovarius sediminis]MCI2395122.1 hypothetical protein [Aliiroseovarius sediminis]